MVPELQGTIKKLIKGTLDYPVKDGENPVFSCPREEEKHI